MKTKRWPVLFACVMGTLPACRSFAASDVALDAVPLDPPLPPVAVEIDEESLRQTLFKWDRVSLGGYSTQGLGVTRTITNYKNVYVETLFARDAQAIIEREFRRLLCTTETGQAMGRAVVEIQSKDQGVNWLFAPFSILTLTMINWLGFPFSSQTAEVKLQISILDSGGHALGRYRGVGRARGWSAFYWGYSPTGCTMTDDESAVARVAMAWAVGSAVEDAVASMQPDAVRLRAALLGSSTTGRSGR